MLAPVATRIVSYGLEVGSVTRAWVDAVVTLPAFQRWEREAATELGVRPVAAHIGRPFAGSVQERVVAGPCYAAIFESQYRGERHPDYARTAARMAELAAKMPGFLGVSSARGADGFGITVSYWSSLDAIAAWRAELEHRDAQNAGRSQFYAHYDLRIARVERRTTFDVSRTPPHVEEYV
jgi:heme-degrading monooxygenase HmoA